MQHIMPVIFFLCIYNKEGKNNKGEPLTHHTYLLTKTVEWTVFSGALIA